MAAAFRMLKCLGLLYLLSTVEGHGRLMDPPARNCMWRFGFRNPVNYNDNELYCGGFIVHVKNGLKCGACGDNYSDEEPRAHETHGLYSNNIVAKKYQMGQVIEVEAELTTNHKGKMKIELCVRNSQDEPSTDECFKKNVLKLADGNGGDQFVIPKDSRKIEIFRWKVQLPEGVTCSDCVIRWTYKTGNTWGTCPDGSQSVGCGNQETFINCADVKIQTNTPSLLVNPHQLWVQGNYPGNVPHGISTRNEIRPLVVRSQLCIPKEQYADIPGMGVECLKRCLAYPPIDCDAQCRCVSDCQAIGLLAKEKDGDIWCHQHCLKHPSYCPKEMCRCV